MVAWRRAQYLCIKGKETILDQALPLLLHNRFHSETDFEEGDLFLSEITWSKYYLTLLILLVTFSAK